MANSSQPVPLHTVKNLSALADGALDDKIGICAKRISHALFERAEALKMVEGHERSAVHAAWELGSYLLEKKRRISNFGFVDWCAAFYLQTGISGRSVRDYMRLARHFGSAANLRPSIRESLRVIRSESREAERDPMAPDWTTREANPPQQDERPNLSLVPPLDDGAPADTASTVRPAEASLSNVHFLTAGEENRQTYPTSGQADGQSDGGADSAEASATILERVREVFGCGIGCNPASSTGEQAIVQADTWYDRAAGRDELIDPWRGPLYLDVSTSENWLTKFVSKLEREISEGRVAEWFILANLIADTPAGQALMRMACCMCIPAGRWLPLGGTAPMEQYVRGQMFIYGGPNVDRFCKVFAEIGQCAIPVKGLVDTPSAMIVEAN